MRGWVASDQRSSVGVSPAGQDLQLSIPSLLYCPPAHGTQSVIFEAGCFPCSHIVQAPPRPAMPTGQATQVDRFSFVVSPSSHVWQRSPGSATAAGAQSWQPVGQVGALPIVASSSQVSCPASQLMQVLIPPQMLQRSSRAYSELSA